VCTVFAEFVQSDFCFLIPGIRDSSACIATGGRLILAGDSVSESEAVGIRFLIMSWALGAVHKAAYLDILLFPLRISVISVIREFPRPSEVEVPPLVNTFLGKLRYGPVSTNLPFKSATSPSEDVQLVDSGLPSRIVHRLFLLVILIEFGDQVVERASGLNDRNRKLHV
jgi:hypothetical protein